VIVEMVEKKKYIAARRIKSGLQALWAADIKPRSTVEAAKRDLQEYAIKRGWQRV
jgi:hypothetical protein